MTRDDPERVLQELRDSNRQLAESSRQIAQSLGNIERLWTTQIQKSLWWMRWGLIPIIVVALLMALVPFYLAVQRLWR